MSIEEQILREMKWVARECGKKAYDKRMNPDLVGTQTKGDKSLVTVADGQLEDFIKERLVGKFGGSFLGEETGLTQAEHKFMWVVDPIDGTTNFSKGTQAGGYPDLSTWGISIALYKDGKPYIGVIYKPQTDELFYAVDGQGAFVETTKFGKTYKSKLELPTEFHDNRTIIGFGIVDRTTMTETHLGIYEDFRKQVKGLVQSSTSRSQGAAGMEAVSVACGTYAAYVSLVAEHDIAAARVILKEAGASVTTVPAKDDKNGYFYLVASHPAIHEELVQSVKKAVNPSLEVSGDLTAEGQQQKSKQ